MGNIENGCHWYFPQLHRGIEEKNTTDSDEETLKSQSSIEALVRESIQNSLDVHDGSNKPVTMEFKFGTIKNPQEKIPAFLEIQKYIQGSKDYIVSEGYTDASFVFDPMIQFMNHHQGEFPYLRVADYNTTGMNPARFKAFTSKGSSFKQSKGAGGSYGIGKAAYYMASQIRTILVSSMYKDDENIEHVVFEGFSKLTTNQVNGTKYYDKGYYDINEAEPIKEKSKIPMGFERDVCGTSVFIMGIDDAPEAREKLYKDILKTVIRNFWMAIHEGKLEVIVDFENDDLHSNIIDAEKLAEIIRGYDNFDTQGDYTNPRPYYEAVVKAVEYKSKQENPEAVFFNYIHEEFGKARFYLIKNDQKHDRFLKMRTPRMSVAQVKTSGKRGYNGVLVCDDKWNELLTYAEPPAHDEWLKKRILEKTNISQEDKDKAALALDLINRWVMDCINRYFKIDQYNEVDFYGIKDLLYTDKDLDSNSRKNGDASAGTEGFPSNEEGDSGIMTSKSLGIDGEGLIKTRPIASVTAVKKTTAQPDEKGNKRGKRRKKHKPFINPKPKVYKPGTNFPVSNNKTGQTGHYREIFDVDVRCFKPSGQEEYNMVIISKKKIDNAMIELSTGGAIQSVEVPIAYSDKGTVDKHCICEIPLEIGVNILHFKFEDKMSHSIKVATYEFK